MTNIILNRPNFLASEVGLRTVNCNFLSTFTGAVTENGRKIIKAGTIYPSNDASAKGIVFQDVDVTDGNRTEALMVGGVYLSSRLSATVSATAKPVFQAMGLFEQAVPTDVFPSDGSLD